jgi:hypothetical protein
VIGTARVAHPADVLLVRRVAVVVPLVGAALIHGSLAGEHFGEWFLAGLFLLGVQLVELVLAVLAWFAWSRPVALLVVVSGLGTLTVWTVSRTAGMPFGPADFQVPEPVGQADVLCGLLELASIVAALPELRRSAAAAGGTARPQGRVAAVLVAAVALALTAWALGPAVGGGHHHSAEASSSIRAP